MTPVVGQPNLIGIDDDDEMNYDHLPDIFSQFNSQRGIQHTMITHIFKFQQSFIDYFKYPNFVQKKNQYVVEVANKFIINVSLFGSKRYAKNIKSFKR